MTPGLAVNCQGGQQGWNYTGATSAGTTYLVRMTWPESAVIAVLCVVSLSTWWLQTAELRNEGSCFVVGKATKMRPTAL